MGQTNEDLNIPDIINKSTSKNFTQIPNELLRNKNLSYKAKGLISLLLSNEEGWRSYLNTLESMGTDGASAIKTGLQELEREGYLLRIRYRDKEKKRIQGSFWIYTDKPGKFEDLEETEQRLNQAGMVADWPNDLKAENLKVENQLQGNLILGNQRLKRLINKNKKRKKNNSSIKHEKSSQSSSTGKLSAKERTKKYIPLAQYLAKVVRSHIDYDIDARRVKKWARDLRLLHEQNGVHPNRQKKVLKWYKKNIGGDYIPEAFSGSSFRDKFPKLEAAIKRQNSTSKSGSQPTNGYKAKTKQDYSDDETV